MFSFCKPVSDRKRFKPHRTINTHYDFTLFAKAAEVNHAEWEKVTGHRNIFLDLEYLRILESAGHSRVTCRYVIVYRDHQPCGVLYFQIVDFNAGTFGELITSQVDNIRSGRMNVFARYIDSNRNEVLLRLFTCGNNLVSGEHGFAFTAAVKESDQRQLVLDMIDVIGKEEKLSGTISAALVKDFAKPFFSKTLLAAQRYTAFMVEPNLIVELPPQVHSVEDYVSLFSKKYRNRARSIFRKLQNVEVRKLSAEEIVAYEPGIYALYENIFARAKFRLIKLPSNYFSRVKAAYKDHFSIKGFFLEGKLVAFASSFVMHDGSLEAHYIGFDYDLNGPYELYQNILYAMIQEGILHNCRTVNLGRTAAEIKTTVGARPKDLICYIKPQNTISKLVQRPFISFLQPGEWTPRNPFKEDDQAEKGPAVRQDRT